jgi:hypothetical protein
VREAGAKLSIWCRVGDWYGIWPQPDVPGLQRTKPASVISQIVRRLDALGFDDVCFHEAWNVEPNDLWPALRGE